MLYSRTAEYALAEVTVQAQATCFRSLKVNKTGGNEFDTQKYTGVLV